MQDNKWKLIHTVGCDTHDLFSFPMFHLELRKKSIGIRKCCFHVREIHFIYNIIGKRHAINLSASNDEDFDFALGNCNFHGLLQGGDGVTFFI